MRKPLSIFIFCASALLFFLLYDYITVKQDINAYKIDHFDISADKFTLDWAEKYADRGFIQYNDTTASSELKEALGRFVLSLKYDPKRSSQTQSLTRQNGGNDFVLEITGENKTHITIIAMGRYALVYHEQNTLIYDIDSRTFDAVQDTCFPELLE